LHEDSSPQTSADSDQPVVLTMTETLTRRSAERVREVVRLLPRPRTVVVDVTTIPGFDTDGISELIDLRDGVGPDRLIIVGLREATSRLIGGADVAVEPTVGEPSSSVSRLRRLPGVVMLTAENGTSPPQLRVAVDAALAEESAIVIIDLEQFSSLSAEALDVLTFASSQAAMAGQELVLLNVSHDAVSMLRGAGLAPTTYIASAT
jgi:anti-anti-sigma regulatory factor